jgi:extracellular factor (EF) 3-hydroxypalmitic acid methyl ester biosynthesis protein
MNISVQYDTTLEANASIGSLDCVALRGRRAPSSIALDELSPEVRELHAEALVHERSPTISAGAIIDWCQTAHDCLARLASDDVAGINLWRELLLPFFLKSSFLKRCHDKPRGYAGDYLTIQMMYEGTPRGVDHFGQAADAWAMSQPCPRAVRNRRLLVGEFVRAVCEKVSSPSVVSLGCGPASEVFDSLSRGSARFTLIDIDADAISYVQERARAQGADARIITVRGNIIKMVLRDEGNLPGNHAAFYSMGLIDYFKDDLVIQLLNYVHSKLAPGGTVLLGNFRPDHPNVALFRHALDWPLVLRSGPDLLRLVAQSRFASSLVRVGTEGEGVQLFVECVKSGP